MIFTRIFLVELGYLSKKRLHGLIYICQIESNVWFGRVLFKTKTNTIGIPKVFILGPMFFVLFVNDYPKCLQFSKTNIYADDTPQDVTDQSVDVI